MALEPGSEAVLMQVRGLQTSRASRIPCCLPSESTMAETGPPSIRCRTQHAIIFGPRLGCSIMMAGHGYGAGTRGKAVTRDAARDIADRAGISAGGHERARKGSLRRIDFWLRPRRSGVAIVCFPETYLPGYRGLDFMPPPMDQTRRNTPCRACVMWRAGIGSR